MPFNTLSRSLVYGCQTLTLVLWDRNVLERAHVINYTRTRFELFEGSVQIRLLEVASGCGSPAAKAYPKGWIGAETRDSRDCLSHNRHDLLVSSAHDGILFWPLAPTKRLYDCRAISSLHWFETLRFPGALTRRTHLPADAFNLY